MTMVIFLPLILLFVDTVIAQDGKSTCTPFHCPNETEPVPKIPLELISLGCSNMGGGSEIGTTKTSVLEFCCALQQACLQICGNAKAYCDAQFAECNNEVCEGLEDAEEKSKCEKASILYKAMVKVGQCTKVGQFFVFIVPSKHYWQYDEGQMASCRCVAKEEAPNARVQVVRSFLEVHNPEKVDQASVLAERANTPKKMADLLLKMVTMYPNAIKIGKDQQKEGVEGNGSQQQSPGKSEDLGTEEL